MDEGRERSGQQPTAGADGTLQHLLEVGELLLAYRESAVLSKFDGTAEGSNVEGKVYLTDRRLLHIGSWPTAIRLSEIVELTITETHLLITLVGTGGVALRLNRPRELRVQIAAAKAAARGEALDKPLAYGLNRLPEAAG